MRRPSGVERHVFVAEEAQLSSAQSAEMLELQKSCFQHVMKGETAFALTPERGYW
jgi:hypothetical protein